jgi:peptidoglycan/LPS O-acetylase OafA/YrhL
VIYGFLQPVLPAILIYPTTIVWKVIGILRAFGWYAMIPLMILSPLVGATFPDVKRRKVILWLSFIIIAWILFTALRGGGDQWDNPRYRNILFLWQSIVAGHVWLWWRETKNAWLQRVVLMELLLILVFGNWYLERYVYIGIELPFQQMVAIILGAWALIFGWGILRDHQQHRV